jgi:hypothetical protein
MFPITQDNLAMLSLTSAYLSISTLEEVDVYFLVKNTGTSVEMIERFYGQT